MNPTKKDEKGMVLLPVLVIVVLLTSLIVEFSFATFVQMRLAETFRDGTKAYYLAKGGVQAGRMMLQTDNNGYDSSDEMWGQSWDNLGVADGAVSIRIEDLGGKLDVNRLVTNLGNVNVSLRDKFLRFFEQLEIADGEELTDALIDWMDPDRDPRPFGAEDEYYVREKGYACKNGKLDSLAELAMIRGFSADVIDKIGSNLTLYGSERINVNTAGPEVLMSLSSEMTREAASNIVEYRETNPFKQVTEVKDVPGLQEEIYFSIRPHIDVRSNFYHVNSTAGIGDAGKRIQAVIQKDKNQLLSFKVH
ncbi:MAG: type II secretion system minor pseudopilin GspK [Syntrophotaleaceae bacterium]